MSPVDLTLGSPRTRHEPDYRDFIPVHVVWELTLACNLKCSHCGSRAGKRRPNELTTDEALEVVEALARLGTRELTIIGGEAYLRRALLHYAKLAQACLFELIRSDHES